MNHAELVGLLRDGVAPDGGVWADLGSGEGAFTMALSDLLGPGATVHSVDRDAQALRHQQERLRTRFPAARVEYLHRDFSRPLDLPPLDGVVMANSLHFERRKQGVLKLVHGYLKPAGRLLLVEYNSDVGNHWVPYPLSFTSWQRLAEASGFTGTRLLATRPSRFLHEIYSAISLRSS